ncbi:PorP/SprF family type IX secretion system membrane protein [Sinomicrobium oceani]|uniref:PorP/SprF family type IX secretion system membrane protein n=1 Tax=Sinomicrobium oceani TaxID=1150368 RepID=UPI00227B5FBE|nr:PorP/SprF family type IX secretion system membrane protein [Sinomicrobium oceani]
MRNIKTHHYLYLFAILISKIAMAQQTPSFPEYNYNPMLINPAYTGMTSGPEITLSHNGYVGSIPGSSQTSAFSFHTPAAQAKMGLGAAVYHDKIGVTTNTNVFLSYSYKIFFDLKNDRPSWEIYDQHVLSFGITAGVRQFRENLLELGIPDDPVFSENIRADIPSVGVGFLYHRADFYIGISAPNILGDRLASRDDLHLSNPVYGYVGYRFFADRFDEVIVKPNLLIKNESGAPLQADINISTSFRNKFEIGAGYRSSASINFMAGIYLFRHFRLLYHYNTGRRNSVSGNSHGVVITYAFGNYSY